MKQRTSVYRIPLSATMLKERHRGFFRKMSRYLERYNALIQRRAHPAGKRNYSAEKTEPDG